MDILLTVQSIPNMFVPLKKRLISFYIKSLFTNVPLKAKNNMILWRIFENKGIETRFTRKEMKDPISLCTEVVHFTFNNIIYKQTNKVAMGSPLGPVLTNIFIVEPV